MTVAPSITETPVSREWVERYLALLNVAPEPPSREALTRLIGAQIRTVVFANVTAILRRAAHPDGPVPPLDPEALLASWEQRRGGAVCFEVTEMFGRLLRVLGYRVKPVLAHISFPGSHQALLVEIDGERYLADAGNGAPFNEPLPIDRVTEVRGAGLAYRFRPDEAGETLVQERLIGGEWQPFCFYGLRPATAAEREDAYQRHHTPGGSWVVDSLRLIRCEADEVFALRDGELSHITEHGKETRQIADRAEYVRLAAGPFRLPALPIEAALAALAARLRSAGG